MALTVLTERMAEVYHYPVMYREVLELLSLKDKKVVVDCTIGIGSHSYKLLEAMSGRSHLYGIDRDQNSLDAARDKLVSFKGRFTLIKDNFVNLDKVLKSLKKTKVDAFLFDLGISTYQLNNPERGFSFLREGPLDMRMDEDSFVCAYDLVNNLSEVELGRIFKKFGEERFYRRIAHSLIVKRKNNPIFTTTQLAQIVTNSVPLRNRHYRIHPATRIFQSLRIAVNRELEVLQTAISKAVSFLSKGGRIAVISFHSLEDRIVKKVFKDYSSRGELQIITRKPLSPCDQERKENSASRSAKLRVAERVL